MKTNPNLKLRRIGTRFMIVADTDDDTKKTHVYELNESAAKLWQILSKNELSLEELTEQFCKEFEIDNKTAKDDIERQLDEWKKFGLIV